MDRSILNRATESTDAPTPGYLYLDIAKNAASSPVACQEIAHYLTSRLSNKANANIKHKCLKVISKTAVSPVTRGQFKRMLAQDANAVAAIKDALQFRGPPDPARGDEPYQRVRTAAKEALDAIYSDAPTSSMDHYQGSGMQGIGSASNNMSNRGFQTNPNALHQPPPASGTGRRMEGIGNPQFKDPRLEPGFDIANMTIGEIAKEATQTLSNMIKDPLARNVEMPPAYGNNNSRNYGAPPGRNQLSSSTGGQWNMASNRGPNAVGSYGGSSTSGGYGGQSSAGGYGGQSSVVGVGGSWGNTTTAVPVSVSTQARQPPYASTPQIGVVTSNATGSGGTAVSDGSFEKNMIVELCPPGGLKAEPPPDKLARFAQAVPSLNADLICPALLDCLEEGNPWIIRAKALCVIETSIAVAELFSPGDNAYASFFYTCRGEIEPLTSHARPAIQQPATRILQLLGVSDGIAAAYKPAPSPAPQADLLDFGADPPPAPMAPPPQAPPTPKAAGGLFGGLTVVDAPKTPGGSLLDMENSSTIQAAATAALNFPSMEATVGGGGGLFGDMVVKETPVPAVGILDNSGVQVAPAPSGGMFDNMMVHGAPPPAAPPTPIMSPSSATGMFDNMVVQGAPPLPVAALAGDIFGDMMVKEAETPATSSFGFINSAPAQVATAAATYDPLLSMPASPSPNTTKATANLGPDQLNAMYAQQQMLIMQQQMAQMQMMMMQQQKMGGSAMLPALRSNVMGSNANFAASSGFSFLDHPGGQGVGAQKKEDKSFDFVKDAMKKG